MRGKLSQDFKVVQTNKARKTYSTLKDYEVLAQSGTIWNLL